MCDSARVTMFFDTARFIIEVQKRPCIWNNTIEAYENRVMRLKAWTEVAEVMYVDWKGKNPKLIQELQRRWKGLRDYFSKNKNKPIHRAPSRAGSESPPGKRRKAPILEMLQFLHACAPRPVHDALVAAASSSGSRVSTSVEDHNDDGRDSDISQQEPDQDSEEEVDQLTLNYDRKSPSMFRELMIQYPAEQAPAPMTPVLAAPSDMRDDPDMMFLLTILPEMKTMTQKANFDFRFEIMKLVKKIKYNE